MFADVKSWRLWIPQPMRIGSQRLTNTFSYLVSYQVYKEATSKFLSRQSGWWTTEKNDTVLALNPDTLDLNGYLTLNTNPNTLKALTTRAIDWPKYVYLTRSGLRLQHLRTHHEVKLNWLRKTNCIIRGFTELNYLAKFLSLMGRFSYSFSWKKNYSFRASFYWMLYGRM